MLSSLDSTMYRTNSDKTCIRTLCNAEGKGREGKGREWKGREWKGRAGQGREGKGREGQRSYTMAQAFCVQ